MLINIHMTVSLCMHACMHRYTKGGQLFLAASAFIFTITVDFFFQVGLFQLISISLDSSWPPRQKHFFFSPPFYWNRLAKSVAAIYRLKITFVPPPLLSLSHAHTYIHNVNTRGVGMKMKWPYTSVLAAETFRTHTHTHSETQENIMSLIARVHGVE